MQVIDPELMLSLVMPHLSESVQLWDHVPHWNCLENHSSTECP